MKEGYREACLCVEDKAEDCTIIHGVLKKHKFHVIQVNAISDMDTGKVQVGGIYRYFDLDVADMSVVVVYDYATDEGHVLFYPELTVIAYEEG